MSDSPKVAPGREVVPIVRTGESGFLACHEDVEAMIANGYSVRLAYEAMKEQSRVTCGYSAFCDYVRGNGKRLHSNGKRKGQKALRRGGGPIIIGGSHAD